MVNAVEVCPHGISLFFPAFVNLQPRYVSLTIHKPTMALLRRSPSKPGGPSIETRMRRVKQSYAELIAYLSAMSSVDLSRGGRVDFGDIWRRKCPILVPWRLTIKWRSKELRVYGCLDIYYTMFS